MWARTVEGQQLNFHLAGIHNQNFLMRDEQTGSFWQQVSGRCIAGPMLGKQLQRVHSEEVTLGQFAAEGPGTVLLGEPDRGGEDYERGWEAQVDRLPTVFETEGLPPRALVAGVAIGDAARAYPASVLAEQPVIVDEVGATPVLLWSRGGRSLRVFDRTVDGAARLFAPVGETLVDADTGSVWDARGCATAGPRTGTCLAPVQVLWDYWFDWLAYNPATSVYGR